MTLKPICPGTRTAVDPTAEQAQCPRCKRVKRVIAGRIGAHYATPLICTSLKYRNGWPEPCTARAREGSKFCGRHGG